MWCLFFVGIFLMCFFFFQRASGARWRNGGDGELVLLFWCGGGVWCLDEVIFFKSF